MKYFKYFFLFYFFLHTTLLTPNQQTSTVQDKIQNLATVLKKDGLVNLEFHVHETQDFMTVEFLRLSYLHLPDDFQDSIIVGELTTKKLRSMYLRIKRDIQDVLNQLRDVTWRWIKENTDDYIELNGRKFQITYSSLVYVIHK